MAVTDPSERSIQHLSSSMSYSVVGLKPPLMPARRKPGPAHLTWRYRPPRPPRIPAQPPGYELLLAVCRSPDRRETLARPRLGLLPRRAWVSPRRFFLVLA